MQPSAETITCIARTVPECRAQRLNVEIITGNFNFEATLLQYSSPLAVIVDFVNYLAMFMLLSFTLEVPSSKMTVHNILAIPRSMGSSC